MSSTAIAQVERARKLDPKEPMLLHMRAIAWVGKSEAADTLRPRTYLVKAQRDFKAALELGGENWEERKDVLKMLSELEAELKEMPDK